jgi:Methyltransferase domain
MNAAAGAAVYSKFVLSIYDLFVLGFSNRFAWRCPSQAILDFYNENISSKHLDVGVGTGWFLDKCTFPTPDPLIALADLNPNSLEKTAQRLQRYRPSIHNINVLRPFWVRPAAFDSIAINYVLHCLPGNMQSKGVVFNHLKALLNPKGGVIFGTTILGRGVRRNPLADALMFIYNAKGIFCNHWDNAAELERVLKTNFYDYELRTVGCVAFFIGKT